MNRIEILKEIGIAPVWKARAAASGAAASGAEINQEGAGKPLVRASFTAHNLKNRPPSGSSGRAQLKIPDVNPPADSSERAAQIARMDWPALKDAVANCRACALCNGRTNTVFGAGDETAKWMIIGEAPGQEEDRSGEPFVGQAGKLLDSMLAALDLTRNVNVYIANVLKCRPPGNRDPQPAEVAQCAPHLTRQIELLRPTLIVLMGRFAAQAILDTDASIASLRGRVFTYRGTPAIVTYHPAYLLRSLIEKAKAWEDLLFARKTFSGT